MGIIYNDASKSISLAKVEDVTFVRSDNQQYKVAVDSDGNLCTELQSTGQLKTLVDNAKKIVFPKAKDDVDEKYVRDFLKCNSIDKYSDKIDIDKILFIYKYGSKKAKKIAVDEKLRTSQEDIK